MEVKFIKIHEVVLEALNLQEKKSAFFKVIGQWYYKFLQSPDEKLILHVPKYEEESVNIAYNYVRLFSLTYRLIHRPELTAFENTSLFNVFDYNVKRSHFVNNEKSTIDFVKQVGEVLYWTDSVLFSKDRFIPVFIKEQIENSHWDAIYCTFKLFKIIETRGLVNCPVLIDLSKDLCLSLSAAEQIITQEFIQFKTMNWDPKLYSQEDAIELEDELLSQDFTHQVSVKYPYHKNIHSYLLDVGKKRMGLVFNSRFYYQNIVDTDIYLFPKEIHANEPVVENIFSKFKILETNHSLPLFKALNEFRKAWRAYEFNKFTTPFPKYWFLFINQSIPKDEWFEMFKTDYPDVSERPIISSVKVIIDLIHDLNWSKLFIEGIKDPVILLPEIKGLKKKKLEKSLNSFKNYLLSNNRKTVFVENNDDYEYSEHKNLLVFDGFNIINLINIFQQNEDLQIVTPDFLYFNYQPWIKYQLLNYQFDALLNPKRELLDQNFNVNKEVYTNQRSELIKGIKSDIIKYRKKYNVEEEIVLIEENLSTNEDIVFRNEEELEISLATKEKATETELQIETTTGKVFKLKSSNQILLQRTSIISCRASYLVPGDSFITMSEINSVIDKDAIINKLSRIPDSVVDFQIELGKKLDVYHTLKKYGLVYKSEKYFNDKYVLNEEEHTSEKFILPKKKDHWKIICEYLGINSIDTNQAWISHYGRRHINEIKGIYKHIFNLCIDGNYLSEAENPELINKIAKFLEEKKEIFEEGEGANTMDLAKSIISAIINELSFHKVKEIKTNQHEWF
jgi:hypothetical protein